MKFLSNHRSSGPRPRPRTRPLFLHLPSSLLPLVSSFFLPLLSSLLLLLPSIVFSQATTKIMLERANSWEYNKDIGPDIQRILGNVILRHDSTYLYCDSAYLNEVQNNVRAYGNVHIRVSDTLNLFGDSLKYDGNTRLARIKNNVKLVDNETVLTTDTLYFDRNTNIARYDDWGKIVNGKNILVSKLGYYHTDEKKFYFHQKVILINPEYIMHSDTLLYNTLTETSYFFGPSTIVGKEDSIYCENGWYDTRKDISRFRKNGIIFHGPQNLSGDSMYYERKTGFGQVFKHAVLVDTVKKIVLKGNYGEIVRKKGYTFMTDSAVAVFIDKKDSLFMHSDTIHATFDTAENIKNIRCFYKVKFYRNDLQGMGDSLAYHGVDSTMTLYHEPVVWSGENQLTADSIKVNIRNSQADSMILYNTAFIISKDDTNKFNQVKGRNMIGYFKNNELFKIRVLGNSETLYYAREDDRSLIGINKAISSDMLIYLEKNKVTDITYIGKPDAVLYPEKDISPYDLKLKNFHWVEGKRPLRKEDIFIW